MMSNEEAAKNIAANVEKLLGSLGWSVRKLSRMTGDPHMSVVNALSGAHVPNAGILARIAEALNVSTDELVRGRKKSRRTA